MYVRKPAVAGSFYPAEPQRLRSMINTFRQDAVVPREEGEIVAVVSPHAGYIYSGPVAAYGYNALAGSAPDVVIVLAPSHQARFSGASVIASGMYETPLGRVPVDGDIGTSLRNSPSFSFVQDVHNYEHSLEVQVPFLQVVLGEFNLVPVIIGTTDIGTCRVLAEDLYNAVRDEKRRLAIVISTDLSHYHTYDEAVRRDSLFIEALEKFDENHLSDFLGRGRGEACGEGPVLTGMILAKRLGASRVKVLKYANSGDTSGDRSRVVGYVSALFTR